jgi:hypothetical protein
MTWNFYLDESGHDGKTTPLVVVGGFGVEVERQTAFINEAKELYKECFGVSYDLSHELKGSYLLHKKKFKWADNFAEFDSKTRKFHAARFLSISGNATTKNKMDFCGYGQACIMFVGKLFNLLNKHSCIIYATCADKQYLKSHKDGTQNFVKLLEAETTQSILHSLQFDKSKGSIFFDKSESSSDMKKLHEMRELAILYFGNRNMDIDFEMLDSEHSLEIQIADICIYCINWGLREYQKSGYTYFETEKTKIGQLLQILDLSWINEYDDGIFNRKI